MFSAMGSAKVILALAAPAVVLDKVHDDITRLERIGGNVRVFPIVYTLSDLPDADAGS